MNGAKGSALEWAIALLRAPGERHALRQKPLPANVDRLLGIAADAMPDALAEAARTFGEPEARLLEAARFYAREVLFFPQADAYRTLGVGRDARPDQIKTHHRLLQLWLHPDRLQSEDDAVFAARVNSAWNRLRSPERRQAYDEALQRNRSPEVFDSGGALRGLHGWSPQPDLRDGRWRHRLPMLMLSASCLVLVLLVMRDMGRRPEAWDFSERRASVQVDEDGGIGIEVPQPDVPDLAAPRSAPDARRQRGRIPVDAMPSSQFNKQELPPLPPAVPVPTHVPSPAAATTEMASAAPSPTAQLPLPEQARPSPSRAVPAAGGTPPPSFARIQSARQAGDQFLRYMGAVDRPPPPIWNSPAIQSGADRVRHDLHMAGLVRLSVPQWRIGNETAVLTSAYTMQGEGSGDGRLTADLVWREGRWLVTGLSMERER